MFVFFFPRICSCELAQFAAVVVDVVVVVVIVVDAVELAIGVIWIRLSLCIVANFYRFDHMSTLRYWPS